MIQHLLGGLSVLIAFVAYGIYFAKTIKGEARPHPLSWLIFGILTGTGFLIQVDEGAGAGSWVMGVTAAICFGLCALSVAKGKIKFPRYEWAFLVASAFVFVVYLCSRSNMVLSAMSQRTWSSELSDFLRQYGAPVSAILATIVDVLGYGPTLTKAWNRPYSDSIASFALNSLKFIPALFAISSVSVATVVYPSTLVVVNGAVAMFLWWRRRLLSTAYAQT